MSNVANRFFLHWAWLLVVLVIVGCGGGGSDSTPRTATPQVSVAWPARSRAFSGLSSARSVSIRIHNALANGQDVTFNENRAEAPAAYTATYLSPQPVKVGAHQVDLKFFADPGASGAQVGSASVAAAVRSDGTLVRADGSPLGTIQTQSVITSVSLLPDQSVDIGEELQLAFSARDAGGNVVAVSSGSATFAVTQGAANLTVSASGLAEGVAAGTATVVVTVDGVASTPATVTVTSPTPTFRSFDANTNSLAYDTQRGLLYATVPADDPINPNAFVAYNPQTGAIVKNLPLPVEPYAIALSDDFQFAYVSQNPSGRVVRVALATFTVDSSFAIAEGRVDPLYNMLVRPGHPRQVVISHFVNGGAESELTLYEDGVAKPNGDQAVLNLAFGGPNKLYGGHFGSMKAYSVDDSGVAVTQGNDNAPGYSYATVEEADGRLYLNSYGVLDGNTLNILGTYPGRLQSALVIPDKGGPYVFGLTWGIPTDRTFQVFRKSDFGPAATTFTIPNAGNSTSAFVRLSPTSFAFNVAGPSKIFVVENVRLP